MNLNLKAKIDNKNICKCLFNIKLSTSMKALYSE